MTEVFDEQRAVQISLFLCFCFLFPFTHIVLITRFISFLENNEFFSLLFYRIYRISHSPNDTICNFRTFPARISHYIANFMVRIQTVFVSLFVTQSKDPEAKT